MKVSVIIITWNRAETLRETLQNICKDPYKPKEIIVIDNNSTDRTEELVRDEFPTVIYKKFFENLGVPGGRNEGIKVATGEILFFIDNDAELMENGIRKIVDNFKRQNNLGVLAPQINNFYSRKLDVSSWVYTIHKLKDKDNSFQTFFFVGCAFAIKREVFERCGLLWDQLFFMHEEKDFAYRVIDKGYQIKYVPEIKVYHKVSPSQRYDISSRFFYYGTRNSIWIFFRYYPFPIAVIKSVFFICLQLLGAIRTKNTFTFLKGLLITFKQMNVPFEERYLLSKQTRKEVKNSQYIKKDSIVYRAARVLGIRKFHYDQTIIL